MICRFDLQAEKSSLGREASHFVVMNQLFIYFILFIYHLFGFHNCTYGSSP